MTRDTHMLAQLRRERGPLATLAVVAVLARVLLSALGIAAMPSMAGATAGATQVICTNTGFATAPLHGVPSHIIDCGCGHVCPHSGGAAADLGRQPPALTAPDTVVAGVLALPGDGPMGCVERALGFSIRAPPLV